MDPVQPPELVHRTLAIGGHRAGHRDFYQAVPVDVLWRHPGVVVEGAVTAAGLRVPGDVAQPLLVIQHKHVGEQHIPPEIGGDEQGGDGLLQPPCTPAADVGGSIRQGGGGREGQHPVPAVIVLDTGAAALLLRLGQDHFLLAIAVQIRGQVPVVGTAHDLRGLAVGDGVPHQGAQGGPRLPADQHVALSGAPQVDVLDGVNLAAHPLDPGIDLVLPLVVLLKDHDAQRGVRVRVPEKGHGLLEAVLVHIHQLDGLPVLPV